MKINDIKMATPIEEKIDQNLKVSLIDCDVSAESCHRERPQHDWHKIQTFNDFFCLGRIHAGPNGNDNDKWR